MRKVVLPLMTVSAPLFLLMVGIIAQWLLVGSPDRAGGPMRFLPTPTAQVQATDAADVSVPLMTLEPISRDQAQILNAQMPFSAMPKLTPAQYNAQQMAAEPVADALDCLTSAVYYEAATEPLAGQRAVAQVVLNRRASPAFPKTICGVVKQGANLGSGCQFTFMCDGSLARKPDPQLWARSRTVADAALNGFVFKDVGASTFYHADYVLPYWAGTMFKLIQIGHHIFYRWPGAPVAADAGVTPPAVSVAPLPAPVVVDLSLRQAPTGAPVSGADGSAASIAAPQAGFVPPAAPAEFPRAITIAPVSSPLPMAPLGEASKAPFKRRAIPEPSLKHDR